MTEAPGVDVKAGEYLLAVRGILPGKKGTLDFEPFSVISRRELAGILGRAVDLVSRRAVEQSPNPIRRRQILESAEPLYAAR